jgi:Raf kinase inhibitor-like YbhB/YbcL family protein
MATFELTAGTFREGAFIPKQHTCEGEDRSPPLRWDHPPAGTRCFALIADDPDAPGGTWVHWVLFNIPIDVRGLAEGLPLQDVLPNDARQGDERFPSPRLRRSLSATGEAAPVLLHTLRVGS